MRTGRVLAAVVIAVGSAVSAAGAATVTPSAAAGWVVAPVPRPNGHPVPDDYSGNSRLACPSASSCEIVSNLRYLSTIEGSSITTVRGPLFYDQPHWSSFLVDVACVRPGDCVATGGSGPGPWEPARGFRDELAHGSWTAEAGTSAWQHVACNRDRCVEIGTVDIGIDQAAIDDRTTGGPWVTRGIATPWQDPSDNGYNVGLVSATCPASGGGCVVLGHALDSSDNQRNLLFRRSGQIWKGIPLVAPRGGVAGSASVYEMSCPSAGNCRGLGTYVDGAGRTRVLVEKLSGGVLSASRVPMPPRVTDPFDVQLSCASMSDCAGFVDTSDGTVLLRLHDGSWAFRRAGTPPRGSAEPGYVVDVSCARPSYCMVVGSYFLHTSPEVLRAAVWILDSGHWSVRALGEPTGMSFGPTANSRLDDVVCRNDRCVVVGTAAGSVIYGIHRIGA